MQRKQNGTVILKRWYPGLVPKALRYKTKTGRKVSCDKTNKYLAGLLVT